MRLANLFHLVLALPILVAAFVVTAMVLPETTAVTFEWTAVLMPVLVLLFRNFYASIPIELFKAARVDGARIVTACPSLRSSAASPVVVPARLPSSVPACRTHLRSVSADPIPSRAATALIAANSLG